MSSKIVRVALWSVLNCMTPVNVYWLWYHVFILINHGCTPIIHVYVKLIHDCPTVMVFSFLHMLFCSASRRKCMGQTFLLLSHTHKFHFRKCSVHYFFFFRFFHIVSFYYHNATVRGLSGVEFVTKDFQFSVIHFLPTDDDRRTTV
jgi:hypothetical protein